MPPDCNGLLAWARARRVLFVDWTCRPDRRVPGHGCFTAPTSACPLPLQLVKDNGLERFEAWMEAALARPSGAVEQRRSSSRFAIAARRRRRRPAAAPASSAMLPCFKR